MATEHPLLRNLATNTDAPVWRFRKFLITVFLSFAVIFSAEGVLAQKFPEGMTEGRNSARAPTLDGGLVTFTIFPGDCQTRTYGDGRGESDCKNGNSKSYLAKGGVRIGAAMRYAFDVRVLGGLTHAAFHNPRAVPFTGGPDTRLSVARWGGNQIKNHLYSLKLDRTRGLTFLGKRCAGPGDLSKWTRFELLIKWSAKSDGVIQVKCNDRVIHAARDLPTDQNPHCFTSNHCEPGVRKNPTKISYGIGIFFDQEVVNGVPTRPRVPKTGLSIQMQNIQFKQVRLK